jgi:serine/threonine protein phosphatase PrpC
VNVSVGAATDVGRVRTGNEDAYLADAPLFVVADGMGGHIAGDIASSTAIEAIAAHRDEANAEDPQTLARLVLGANEAIWERADSDASLQGMGTTCTLVYIDGRRAHIAHVGDSRAYRLRDGALEQLTEDHTLVARMVKEGRLRAEDAERHPQRNVITRALGGGSDVSVDLLAIDLNEGDRLLLCSDGLTAMVEHDRISETLAEEDDPQRAADRLVGLANDAGGEDNITVVVVDVRDGEASRAASAAPAREPPAPPARMPAASDAVGRVRGRWLRSLMVGLVVTVLLGGGGYAVARYALGNAWFVGIDDAGRVTIFNGIPEQVAGLELREPMTTTATTIDDLPQFMRSRVRQGIKVDSLHEAESTVSDLNDRAREFARNGRR